MPIPPNWFGLAAFGLLGAFINPGLWLIGAGLEGAVSVGAVEERALPRHGGRRPPGFTDSTSRYENLLARLDSARAVAASTKSSSEAAEIVALLHAQRGASARRSAMCGSWPGCI